MKISEVARRLHVSRPTARLVIRESIPHLLIHGRIRVSTEAVEEYVQRVSVQPKQAEGK